MNKRVVLTGTAILFVFAIAFGWWYFTSPRMLMESYLACGGSKDKTLISSNDQPYWDEWKTRDERDSLTEIALLEAACLETRELLEIKLLGMTGIVTVKVRSPKLDWDDLTKFPATATKSEKLAILKERGHRAKEHDETTKKVDLLLEARGWKIFLDLEPKVRASRQFEAADIERRSLKWDKAIAIYESMSADNRLPDYARKYAGESRISILAEKACFLAVRQFLKFGDTAEYELRRISGKEQGPINVIVRINAPNAFGVKSRISGDCKVVFQESSPNAHVDVFLVPSIGRDVVDQKRIEVKM